MTGCGCLILIALLVGGIVFMIFGSTDPGEPVAQAVSRLIGGLIALVFLPRMLTMPLRRALVRPRRA